MKLVVNVDRSPLIASHGRTITIYSLNMVTVTRLRGKKATAFVYCRAADTQAHNQSEARHRNRLTPLNALENRDIEAVRTVALWREQQVWPAIRRGRLYNPAPDVSDIETAKISS